MTVARLKILFLSIFIGILLTVSLFMPLSVHAASIAGKTTSCASSCNSHGQPAASQTQNKKDDEKEPTPPGRAWPQVTVDLRALYLAPIFTSTFALYIFKKQLLSTQLRI